MPRKCVKASVELEYEGGIWRILVNGDPIATIELDWALYEMAGAEDDPWRVDRLVDISLRDYIEVCQDHEHGGEEAGYYGTVSG